MPESFDAAASAAEAAGQERMANILNSLDLESMCGSGSTDLSDASDASDSQLENDLPLPRGFLDAHAQSDKNRAIEASEPQPLMSGPSDANAFVKAHLDPNLDRVSDSGLGTSISNGQSISESDKCKVQAGQLSIEGLQADMINYQMAQSAITRSISSFASPSSEKKRQMSEAAAQHIQRTVIDPILKEERLKPFHSLVQSIPHRISTKEITCLRDLEKTLLWLAPRCATSRVTYLRFASFSLQCIHMSTFVLSEQDQRLPSDQPYTNGYLGDLLDQIRQQAAMISSTKNRIIVSGMSSKPKPKPRRKAEVSTDSVERAPQKMTSSSSSQSLKRNLSIGSVDEGAKRSMARRKKNAPPMDINKKCSSCDKVFKRPCDLTKHEKTHSRPWKCSDETCKYYIIGWPTEKERDRHINDKHSSDPCVYRCEFPPCTYQSKRESNCKQHMEKAHGWSYVRSKNNGKPGHRASSVQSTPQSSNANGMLPLPMNNNNHSVFESPVPDLLEPVGLEGSPMTSSDSNSSLNYDLDWNNMMEQPNFGIQQYPYMNNTPMNTNPMDMLLMDMPLMDMSLVDQQSVEFDAMHPYSCDPALPVPSPLMNNACQFDEGVYDMDAALGGGFTVV